MTVICVEAIFNSLSLLRVKFDGELHKLTGGQRLLKSIIEALAQRLKLLPLSENI